MTVVLCYLALTRDPDPETGQAVADPSAAPTAVETGASSSPTAEESIEVPDQRRADFTSGDPLPEASRLYDNGLNRPGLGIRQGALRHGEPTGPLAIGSLETQLDAPVQKLGARIDFADGNSGSVALVAWQSSLIDARQAGDPVPLSGLRLVVSPGLWQLVVYDKGEVVIAGDEYPVQPGPQTFEVSRQGDHAWVVDPSGARTDVIEVRIDQFAGPWACWQLLEETPGERPAAIEAVWAG